ncbi:MAG: class I SAM-dependent methyltransferase, partial [Alphaproteobacteria bacterium]|nr:class I SAM-dependent methyltransferase [Alphaproteobacteria bacterium]
PAAQGVMHWPAHAANLTALAEEWELPLPDAAFDRVLLIHAIETTEHLRPMLREAWRVLNSGGRLLAVTPNRRGLWARAERTPFAQGRPYSLGQLRKLLRDNLFSPVQWASALYPPPADWGFLLKAADAVEEYGSRWFSTFAGVVMIEATKQIYAATPSRAGARVRGIVAVPEG